MKKLLVFVFFLFTIALSAQSDTAIVFLGSIDSTIVTDVRYATTNNFTGKVLYPTAKVYLRKVVAENLSKVNSYLLKNFNLRLKVFDGYRPLSVQKKMWVILPNEDYVANPAKGSRHNRGAAVDVALIDSLGNELDMGTGFDDFSKIAYTGNMDLPADVLLNRKILHESMAKFGFDPIKTEWWHFDFKGWSRFSILDVEIK
ncbi:MAG: peptidase M15 [Ignavibacteriales bacterium]|nr:MAG: peptidase M15 [Ignavibacteriales bacterium]